jgi:hypothetical protein
VDLDVSSKSTFVRTMLIILFTSYLLGTICWFVKVMKLLIICY